MCNTSLNNVVRPRNKVTDSWVKMTLNYVELKRLNTSRSSVKCPETKMDIHLKVNPPKHHSCLEGKINWHYLLASADTLLKLLGTTVVLLDAIMF